MQCTEKSFNGTHALVQTHYLLLTYPINPPLALSRQDWSHEGSNLFPQMAQFGKNTGLQIFFKVQVKVFLAPRAFKQPISIVKSSLPFPVWSHQRSPLNENYTKRPFFRSCRNWTIWGPTLMKSLIYECNSRSKSYVFYSVCNCLFSEMQGRSICSIWWNNFSMDFWKLNYQKTMKCQSGPKTWH